MARRGSQLLIVAIVATMALTMAMVTAGVSRPLAHNVILLIDDGAGYSTHEAGSLYDTGLRAGEAYNRFPFQVAVSTYSYGDVPVGGCHDLVGYDPASAWSDFRYVTHDPTDSAAAATALATGTKTYDAAIGMDCAGAPRENLVEAFERMGKATGVVTSVPISHATPAAFVAHHVDRDKNAVIAKEMIESSATDVIMGGGHPLFERDGRPAATGGYGWISKATWGRVIAGTAGADADGDGVADPWALVQTPTEFRALASGTTPKRVLGVAQVRRTLQQDRVDLEKLPPGTTVAPYSVPFIDTVPTLPEMAAGALNVLDDDADGFFLMIEGGATDWAAHDNQAGMMIEEEIAFNDTVDTVLAWVDEHSNWGETLVIVTSDHETGYVTGPGSGDTADGPAWVPVVDNGIGVLPGVQFNIDAHTNSLVPLYAKGDAGRQFRRLVEGTDSVHGPYIDNVGIHDLLLKVMGASS